MSDREQNNLRRRGKALHRRQKENRAPIWILRGLFPCPVKSPNWLLLCVVLGLPKVTRFRALEAEARIFESGTSRE